MEYGPVKSLKILVVEDDPVNRTLLQGLLSKSPLSISETKFAETLEVAFELLGKNDFDVVLLDLNLPDSDGSNTLLRVIKKYPGVTIVVVTGEDDEETGLKAIAAGAQEYLIKGSYNLETLSKSIRYAIGRKQADQKLRSAEEKYRTIFENSAVAITVADEQQRLISWNKFTENLLGMNRADLYLKSVKSLYPTVEWKKIRALNIRQKGMREHLETKMLKKNGDIINVSISLSALKDSEGKITGSISIISDITERKLIYEILDRKQRSLEAIFDAVPVGMMLVDQDLVVKRVNDAIRQMIGKDYLQLLDQPFGTALNCANSRYDQKGCGHSQACLTCQFRNTIQSVMDSQKGIRDVEVRGTFKIYDRQDLPWMLVGAEPTMINGRKHVVFSINDITEKKEAEQKLKETMELKSQFISTVSHELRTPLAAMKEGVAIVLDGITGRLNEEQKKFLDIAKRNCDRLGALINDVLDFQKFEAGKMNLDLQNNDMKEVASEVHETMALSAKKKAVELLLEFAENLPEAKFDRNKIIQVLTNLVSNAIKFTPQKGRVSVNVRHDNEELVISVSDTGMGIPKEALLKIFERFYRVNRPSEEIQGTGLGLAIVKRIVIMHGGRIEVESEVNQGTTFTVFLPLDSNPSPEVLPEGEDEHLENSLVQNESHVK